ncbi:gamma-crystallin-2-like [Artemia franciscana]
MWIKLAILLVFSLVGQKAQISHSIILYEGTQGWGDSLKIENYVNDLNSVGFNNKASSLCVEDGIWILYDAPSYNMYSDLPSGYFWGEDYCTDLAHDLRQKVSSLRYVGSPFGYKVDGVHLYGRPWFGGTEIFLTGEARISFLVKSLVVTGKSVWTLYEKQDFSGYHVCVAPSNSSSGYPGFYTKEADFGFAGRKIRSIQKDCFP